MKREILETAPSVLKEFIMYMETVKGRSPKTVDEYFLNLRMFFRFLKISFKQVSSGTPLEDIPIDDIGIDFLAKIQLMDVYSYLDYLLRERSCSAAARARHSSAIRSFFKYISQKKQYIKNNPVLELDTPKIKKTLPKYLTLEQSLALLESVSGPTKERDYCILTLFLNCGLRLSELVGINLYDISHDNRTIRVLGKGNKERILPLNDACMTAIQTYLKVRPHEGVIDKNALFISRVNKRLGHRSVENIVEKYLKIIGIGPGYSPHKLRHTAATLMYQHGGVDIRILKDVLGHENLGTTEIYTHISNKQMERAVESNPLSKSTMKKKKNEENGADT